MFSVLLANILRHVVSNSIFCKWQKRQVYILNIEVEYPFGSCINNFTDHQSMDIDNLFVILFSIVTELLVKTEYLISFWQHQFAYLKTANGCLGAMASFGLPRQNDDHGRP